MRFAKPLFVALVVVLLPATALAQRTGTLVRSLGNRGDSSPGS